jgi:hypothetical protein
MFFFTQSCKRLHAKINDKEQMDFSPTTKAVHGDSLPIRGS